jgi:hypothetical protein
VLFSFVIFVVSLRVSSALHSVLQLTITELQ